MPVLSSIYRIPPDNVVVFSDSSSFAIEREAVIDTMTAIKSISAGGMLIFLALCILYATAQQELLVESISHRILQRQLGEAADTKIEGTSGKLFKGDVIRKFDGKRLFEKMSFQDLQKKYKSSSGLKPISPNRCTQWAVVTTINEPTEAVERQAIEQDWCLVVVGDKKGPRSYPLPNAANWTVFLDDKSQEEFVGNHPLGKLLPWNHFGRKNIGFIFAILHGATTIFDFDDDNMLVDVNPAAVNAINNNKGESIKNMRGNIHGRKLPIGANINSVHHHHHVSSGTHDHLPPVTSSPNVSSSTNTVSTAPIDPKTGNKGQKLLKKVLLVPGGFSAEGLYHVNTPIAYNFTLLNPYPLMGASVNPAWPRGYPLHLIKPTYHQYITAPGASSVLNTNHFVLNKITVSARSIGVVQYLANNDPDVDAIYRLIQPLPLNFALTHHPLQLPLTSSPEKQVYCPYNAQATLHMHAALWTLLLPITVHGRVSDIWRSYFAQRLMFDVELSVVFHPPYVVQYRNSHNYLADFDSEGPLYLQAGMLVQQLAEWFSCAVTLPERMEALWIMLYERGYIQKNDVELMQMWIQSLIEVQYPFPEIKRTHASCAKK